jgi:hypothetical protein
MNPLAIIGLLIGGLLIVSGIAYSGVGLPSQSDPLSIRQDSIGSFGTSTTRTFRGGSTNYGK